MSDLDAMLAMLDRAKIEFEREIIPISCKDAGHTELMVERGYTGFVSCLIFSPDGALVSIEAYE